MSTCQGCGAPIQVGRSRPRKWCSERCRKASYGDPCIDCGKRTTYGAQKRRVAEPRCAQCAATHAAAPRRAEVERLWAEGLTGRQIAESLGWAPKTAGRMISGYRARGYDLPHRRTPEQIARITAGSDERLANARRVSAERRAA